MHPPGDSGMEEGGGERGPGGLVPVKSRDCLTGSESARRNGELEIDLVEICTTTFLGVSID